jgi:hypothetical protein
MKRHYTRAELCEKLRELGFPISFASLNKLCAPAIDKGPPVHSWWGSRPLYELNTAMRGRNHNFGPSLRR